MVVIFCKNCKNLMQTQHEDNESNLQCLSCLGNNPIINNTISNVVYKESKIITEYTQCKLPHQGHEQNLLFTTRDLKYHTHGT